MNNNLAYQEERCQELINGKIFMMSPRPSYFHNQVSNNIYLIFGSYLRGKRCTAIADGTALFLSETNHFVPDFMLVCDPDKIKADGVHGAPDLVAEVLSPGTAKMTAAPKCRFTKVLALRNIGWLARWIKLLSNICCRTAAWFLLRPTRCSRITPWRR